MKPKRVFRATVSSALLVACGGADPADPVVEEESSCLAAFPESQFFAATSRGAIPALDLPEVVGTDASFMRDADRVLGVEINGAARAYPFGILWWHELVNDTLGGVDVLVSYCPLTGSGIVFDPTVDGEMRDFVVSGLLYNSNLVMLDRQTESLWNQMMLGSQCGVDRGEALARFPVVETTWEDWKTRYPATTVLGLNTGFTDRPYFLYPYGDYADPDNDRVDFLPETTIWRNWLKTKELVLGVFDGFAGAEAIAYSLEKLAAKGVSHIVNDQVGSTPYVVVSRSQWNTAQAFHRRVNGEILTFTLTNPEPFVMTDDQTGSEWNSLGESVSGPLAGQQLAPVADSFVAFWFAWSLYYRGIRVYT
jgi:hypothetical protein